MFGDDERLCRGSAFELHELGGETGAVNKYIGRFIPSYNKDECCLEVIVRLKASMSLTVYIPLVFMALILAWQGASPDSAQGGTWLWITALLGWAAILLWHVGRVIGLRYHGSQILRSWLTTAQPNEDSTSPISSHELSKNTEYFRM